VSTASLNDDTNCVVKEVIFTRLQSTGTKCIITDKWIIPSSV